MCNDTVSMQIFKLTLNLVLVDLDLPGKEVEMDSDTLV